MLFVLLVLLLFIQYCFLHCFVVGCFVKLSKENILRPTYSSSLLFVPVQKLTHIHKKSLTFLVLYHFFLFILSNHMEKVFIPSGSFLANDNERTFIYVSVVNSCLYLSFCRYTVYKSESVPHELQIKVFASRVHKTLFQEQSSTQTAATTLINTNAEKNFSLFLFSHLYHMNKQKYIYILNEM